MDVSGIARESIHIWWGTDCPTEAALCQWCLFGQKSSSTWPTSHWVIASVNRVYNSYCTGSMSVTGLGELPCLLTPMECPWLTSCQMIMESVWLPYISNRSTHMWNLVKKTLNFFEIERHCWYSVDLYNDGQCLNTASSRASNPPL